MFDGTKVIIRMSVVFCFVEVEVVLQICLFKLFCKIEREWRQWEMARLRSAVNNSDTMTRPRKEESTSR